MKIPLLDLQAQYQEIKLEINAAIAKVLSHQKFIMGPEVAELEFEIAQYCGVKHAVACASGSDAILLSLMAAGVSYGDAVVTTPYTFFATAGAISRLGATPVFVDIDPRTYNIDPNCIEDVFNREGIYKSRITNHKTQIKAIVPVHLYGQMVNMSAVMEIARRYNVVVVEDAAQAIGAEIKGRRAGSIGDFGCFSFFPSKNLGCMGDGGMITINDDVYAEKLRILRVHGSKPKYYHKIIGCNSRLDTIQAAILRVKLRKLDEWTAARQQNALWYDSMFKTTGLLDRHVILPHVVSGARHIYNQYVLRVKERDGLLRHLKDNNIGTEIYYPVPLHLQECFSALGYHVGDLPNAEAATNETLAIPVYPELAEGQRVQVVESIMKYYSSETMVNK